MSLPDLLPLEENVPLRDLTTLGVGGPARYLARCRTPEELRRRLAFARENRLAVFVLGGGSNLLVADRGFDGLVLKIEDEELTFQDHGNRDDAVLVRAGAGVDWDALVAAAVDAGLAGLECLSGIPGRAGAAPIQNVGAYGQEVAETIAAVHAVELETGNAVVLKGDECGFAYRWSHFKGPWRGRYAVVAVEFRLVRRTTGTVRYPDLRRRLGTTEDRAAPGLLEVRQAVIEVRRSKSMVLDADDPNRRSAGSFFVNPMVTPEDATAVRRRLGDDMPSFPAPDGRVKLAAAWLIERAGFSRGEGLGRARLSSRHSLALVNTGGATATEIVALARRIRDGVREASGVVLRPEPVFLGFGDDVEGVLGD